jgi:hypothetical protein
VTAASNAVFKLFFEAEMQPLLHLISLLKKTFKKLKKRRARGSPRRRLM